MINISCVVVTYNRLELLKENIKSLLNQTYAPNKIYIINNCSTDGTAGYLAQFNNHNKITVVNLPKNIGGAGGFNHGTKLAVKEGAGYVWLMDDDTIPEPDALEHLVKTATAETSVGFEIGRAHV